jgi:phage terminase Nu1 subunit (DNA packaging protein)
MTEATLADIERMTGITYKTLKKRLESLTPARKSGVELYYRLREVLPLLYAAAEPDALDLTQQRARLAKAQADKTELEVLKMSKNLIDVDEWGKEFSQVLISIKDRLRNLALRIADNLSQCQNREEAYKLINTYVTEVLDDIATTARHCQ